VDKDVRTVTAKALEESGDTRAVEPLIRALWDSWAPVRRAAAEALSHLGQPVWLKSVTGEAADFARLAACGDPRGVELLILALRGPCSSQQDLEALVDALCSMKDVRAFEALTTFIQDEARPRDLRTRAARSMIAMAHSNPSLRGSLRKALPLRHDEYENWYNYSDCRGHRDGHTDTGLDVELPPDF
jgi:HEAT repeat protein